MTTWQRRTRLVIALSAVVLAVVVAVAFRRRTPQPAAPAPRTDPGVVVESTGGRVERFKFSREDIRVAYGKQLTFADGSSKLLGVTITMEERTGARSFTVSAREGQVGQNESTIVLDGDVRLTSSDGTAIRAGHGSYTEEDAIVRAPGPVEFSRGRMSGTGVGMTYDTASDVLSILDQAVVHVAPDENGAGAVEIASGAAEFARDEHRLRFERGVTLRRAGQATESESAVVHLSDDETRTELVELRGHSHITMETPPDGGLQTLGGRDIDLWYSGDGETFERAVLTENARILLAGSLGSPGRQIAAGTMEVTLGPDGTPGDLDARDAVQLTLPGAAATPGRTIRAAAMDGEGQPGQGLTRARFTGHVQYRERGADVDRTASAATLDLALGPGMSAVEDARFAGGVRFVDGRMTAVAASLRYDLEHGALELTGPEPGGAPPHVVDDRMAIDATRIDIALAGPRMTAAGAVKSALRPAKDGGRGGPASTRLPAMLKPDRPVNVTADALEYDGQARRAVYTGHVQLWQDEVSIKGGSIVLDDKTGDLTATGTVATVMTLEEARRERGPQRLRSRAGAEQLNYQEGIRRALYSGNAHLNSAEGDLTASTIELYLKPSGDALDRVEAHEKVKAITENRTITGTYLSYTADEQTYRVTGEPATIVDECRRETSGRTIIYRTAGDVTRVDGNDLIRTQIKGGPRCP